MRFRVLGPLEVKTGQDWVSIGAAKWRAVLASLLLRPGQVVSTDTLIDELWGDDPPARASNLVSIYVLRLRRLIGDSEGQVLKTRSPGYQLLLGPDDLDTQRFGILMSQGREALTVGDPERAAQLLADSLALWRGKAMADVPPSAFVDAEAKRLDELRLAVLELRIEADIACDRGSLAIPDLRRLLSDEPLKEKLWLLLMRALDAAGRHAEALGVYEQARTVIADQLGVDPGPEMQRAFQRLLSGAGAPSSPGRKEKEKRTPAPAGPAGQTVPATRDKQKPAESGASTGAQVINLERARPSLQAGRAGTAPSGPASPAAGPDAAAWGATGTDAAGAAEPSADPAVPGVIALGAIKAGTSPAVAAPVSPAPDPGPMQLPSDIRDFTGRELHVEHLCTLLSPDENPGAVPVALVAGAGGLGKTTLAIHAAHRVRSEYPDGQLYLDLLGASSRSLSPAEVLARFLRDLGVQGAQIPAGEEERAALYRTRLNGRRMLVVLDNARDAAQVRPLLPGSGTSAVIVTSRSRLPDLVGGGLVHLDVLDDHEGLTLFSRIVGAERAAAEPDATAELLLACAGLPLAIRISAARLASRSTWTIRSLADRLCDEHRRLDELKVGDLAVRASFEVSFASLPPSVTSGGMAPARVFRMLGLWHGPSIGLRAAAALLGEDEDRVADALEYLVDAHLLESTAPDCYSFHDLLRVYAAERAFADEAREVTYEAVHRMVAWYLHTASAANAVVAPQRDTVPLDPLPPGCTSLTFRDVSGALDWCTQERANIVAATRQAADEGLHDIAWKLPVAVLGCFNALSYRAEWLASHLVALASAQHAGDRRAEAWVLNNLGMVCIQQRMDDATGYFDQALAIGRDTGDRRTEAQAANNLADAYIELGRPEDALEPLKRTLALQIEVGHRYGQGVTLNNLGEAYLDLGRPEEAIDSIEQARSIFVEIKTLRGEGYVAHNLGRSYADLGRPDEAVRYFRSALHIRQAAGERHGQALTLLFLGRAYRRLGRIEDARRSWTDAQVIFEDLGDEALLAESRAELTSISVPTA
jgi:DNA-binding SARP family transcriptional activator/Tfp pilus assembly protein PilF